MAQIEIKLTSLLKNILKKLLTKYEVLIIINSYYQIKRARIRLFSITPPQFKTDGFLRAFGAHPTQF